MTEKLVFHAQHKKPIGWVMQRSWVWSYKCDLVGGLEHVFIFPYIGNVIIPADELIFFRGAGSTTNQTLLQPGNDKPRNGRDTFATNSCLSWLMGFTIRVSAPATALYLNLQKAIEAMAHLVR